MDDLFVICRTGHIEDGQATGFVLMRAYDNGDTNPWPIIITRKGKNFYGFENSCPHEQLRLDTSPGNFLDESGNFLECGQHHSQFDLDTGHCFIGPCQGGKLTPLSLVVDDGDLCITGVMLADE